VMIYIVLNLGPNKDLVQIIFDLNKDIAQNKTRPCMDFNPTI
jgi:hypothetical protein